MPLAKFTLCDLPLSSLNSEKTLISTLNAHCYNIAQVDVDYQEALLNSEVLIPDGISIVWALRWLTGQKIKKIAGADLFFYEMERLNSRLKTQESRPGKVFFLGSTENTLQKIKERANREYPNVLLQTYSPPYKPEFSKEDNAAMLQAINSFQPDVLMVGMTAPKQEKWAYQHYDNLQVGHICCIGAVFDFYAGTVKRAPDWMIKMGLEWLYRLIKEPRRLWRRYLIGNIKFLAYMLKESFNNAKSIK